MDEPKGRGHEGAQPPKGNGTSCGDRFAAIADGRRRGPKRAQDLVALLPAALRIMQDPILLCDHPLTALTGVQRLAADRYAREGEWAAGYALRDLLRSQIGWLVEHTEEATLSGQAARYLQHVAKGQSSVGALRGMGVSKSSGYARIRPFALLMLARALLRPEA